jgi:hypothetical protein
MEVDKKHGWVEARRLMLLSVEQIIQDISPCPSEMIVANIEYKIGLSHEKAQQALGVFFDMNKIKIDKDKNVRLIK